MWVIVRMIGVLCVMMASFLAGIGLEHRMKRRWRIYQEMQETLVFLEKEMTYHRSPVQEAFRCAAGRCRTELTQVLDRTAARIGERSGKAFETMWEESLAACLPDGLFSQEELQLFRETSAALCNTDIVIQKTLLEKYADRFRMLSGKEAEACREKGGLYRKLTAAAGVFLVIVLL